MSESRQEITIESGVPFSPHGNVKYPLHALEVGQSFLVPEGATKNRIAAAACRYGKNHNKKFGIRKTPDGYRCWRIA